MTDPIELKGGAVTLDRRLDRVQQFDERSRGYGIVPVLREQGVEQPVSRVWDGGPVTDQGAEGACVGHGWTGELTAEPEVCGIENPMAYAYELYHQTQHRDPWPGCSLGTGCPVEPTSTTYGGTSVLSAAQILQERGLIAEYRWAFGLDDLVLALGHHGPAVLGIPWYESMYEAPDGVITVKGKQVGGHCILARGVNVEERYVLLRNSWGPDYGIQGDGRISFADLTRLLGEGGEACIPVTRVAKSG